MKKTSKEILKTLLKNQELIMKALKIEIPVVAKKEKAVKAIKKESPKTKDKSKSTPVEKKK